MQQHSPGAEDSGPQSPGPLRACRFGVEAADLVFDLGEGELDEAVEDRVLVRQVVVDRHRLDAEVVGQPAHREGVDPSSSAIACAARSTRSRVSGARTALFRVAAMTTSSAHRTACESALDKAPSRRYLTV